MEIWKFRYKSYFESPLVGEYSNRDWESQKHYCHQACRTVTVHKAGSTPVRNIRIIFCLHSMSVSSRMERSLLPSKYRGENSHERDTAMDRQKYKVFRVQHFSGHLEVLCRAKWHKMTLSSFTHPLLRETCASGFPDFGKHYLIQFVSLKWH